MQGHNIRVDFPMDQSCCGLPVVMMGQRETARDVALQNMDAFEKGDYDVILTLCASCASQLKAMWNCSPGSPAVRPAQRRLRTRLWTSARSPRKSSD